MSTLGKSLKVVERERFFDDSFFREAWDDFDRAMQSVLLKFDTKVDAGSRTQCQDAYSKIRSNNIDQDLYASQAVQINEKDGKFQAVMDVKDFNPRELQVRAVDDRIVVEGSYQKVSEDGSSSSSKSFFREFALPPAADIDHVSTALSKDGILTIKAPKKEGFAVGDGPRPSNSSSTTSSIQQSSSCGDNSSSFKSSSQKTTVQSSSSIDSSGEGFDSLPRELREKLMFCDSGFGSTKTSTCSSPAPSEAGSECSRVSSTMEFDLAKKAPMRTEVAFNVSTPSQPPSSQPPPQQAKFQPPPPQQQQQPPFQQQQQPPQQQFQSPPQAQFQQQPTYQSPPQSPPYQQQPQSPFQPPPPQGGYQSPPPQAGYQSPPPQAGYQSPPQQGGYQSPPPQGGFQSPPPQGGYQSPPPQGGFQSPPPQGGFQSPPPQQFQSPPMSPFQQSPPQGQFQQIPPQGQFQQPSQPGFQPPSLFMSPMAPQMQMFQQFPQQFGGQACQSMPPNTPQQAWDQSSPAPSVAVGSGKQSNVNITEKNGRRVLTSQTSDVVQEKDGFMEHRETAAEITDKDSQAARREASSRMTKKEEDPKGKFKRTESADAAEVNESCVQQMPDGSVMSVKKSSTSTSSFKQSFSSSGEDSFFQPPPAFPVGFGDFRNLMGRGHNLMSQMSTDSMGSTLSGRSGFTDMSNFSQFSDTSSQFSDRSNFSNMQGFPDMGQMPMNRPQQQQQPPQQQQQQFPPGPGNVGPQSFSGSYSNSNSFSKSSFSSNFGNGTNF